MNNQLIYDLCNLAFDIYKNIGPGYNECIYHNAMEVGLRLQGINYQSEVITPIHYKSHNIGSSRVDLIIEYESNKLIIELKALQTFSQDTAIIQIKNYMMEHKVDTGLIINFGQPNRINNGELNLRIVYNNDIYDCIPEDIPLTLDSFTKKTQSSPPLSINL